MPVATVHIVAVSAGLWKSPPWHVHACQGVKILGCDGRAGPRTPKFRFGGGQFTG